MDMNGKEYLARMAEQAAVKIRLNTPVDQLLSDVEQIN